MKMNYFSAESREAAEDKAAASFGADKALITFEVISSEAEGTQQCLLLAIQGSQEAMANMDASYKLVYEENGVYLEIYSNRGGGRPLDPQALLLHINRKSVEGINSLAMQALVDDGKGRACIAGAQSERIYGEDLAIEISRDDMEASVRLLAPEPGGAALDLATAKQKLEDAGVIHGVDEQKLLKLFESKDYDEPYVIAVSTQPVDGEDGKLIFHFSKDERTGRPREIGGGRVDYRSLDLYEPAIEGQLLVTRTLATEGIPGSTVSGRPLKQKPGKEALFPKGKNVDVNEEKTEMRSKCSGMVEFINNSVNVSSVYKVNGDCDLSVGNIDFDGSVTISGSVRSGHTIKATGAVVVGGGVEAATIIAGGNVEVKNGVQGAGKGRIEAGGSVTALYVERATVVADGSVTVDVSIHSLIETGGTLTAKGKRGAIIGGRTSAAGDIIASYIGAVSNTQTEVAVGVMPRKRDRIQILEKEIDRLNNEMNKLDQLDTYLNNKKGILNQETWDKLYNSGVENRKQNQESLDDFNAEINSLKYELEHATEGKVHVFETIYHGARVVIGSDMYKVDEDISFSTFRYKEGYVTYGPCEKSKQ